MASPFLSALPSIFGSLTTSYVIGLKWLIDHAHIAKIVVVCIIIATSFWMGLQIYGQLVSFITTYLDELNATVPSGAVGTSLSILAKANYCLPVSEMLALLSVYVTCWGFCIAIRFVISMYRNVPFKKS